MFKDLRPNTPFYVFDKGEPHKLQIGTVMAVSQPTVKPQTNYSAGFQFQPEYIVDIRVKVDDSIMNFNQLPANLQIADLPNGGQKIVVSSNRDLIKTEIETTLANSITVIESISKHENIARECEKILQELNPSFKKEKEQEEEIKSLRSEVSELKDKLGGLERIEKMLIEQSKQSTNNKNNKL